ncbi:MAG: hypothetical protein AUH85_12475 [Chloroflexi bacterium 13_1_40CM_4_68_4]|nr:MAG: hypothetical protein AUH85_12475 [Chloroflexi bacterium 13_1_40CM_4_68_4]
MTNTVQMLPQRLELEPEGLERGLARLVLSLIELLREVIERQAVRRVEVGDLTPEEVERVGLALLRLDQRLAEMRNLFELTQDDVTLRLRVGGAGGAANDER